MIGHGSYVNDEQQYPLRHLNFPKRQTFASSHVGLRIFVFLAWREILSGGVAKHV